MGAQPGEGEGDWLSPWEVEVHGVQPGQAVRMPERLQVALVSSLSAVARTEAMALLDDKDTAAAHTSAGMMAGTAAAMGSVAAFEASCVAGSSSSAAAASSMAGGVVVGVVGAPPASSSSAAAASLNPAAAAASARAAAAEMGRTAPAGMLTRREAELAETTRFKAALVPIDLKLVLARLKAGYYRQWAAVKHDLELLLARLSSSPSLAPLAEAVAPALYAAVSEDAETRRTWQALHDAAVSSGEMGRAMAMARPKGKVKMAGGGEEGDAAASHSSAVVDADGMGESDAEGGTVPSQRVSSCVSGFKIRCPRPPPGGFSPDSSDDEAEEAKVKTEDEIGEAAVKEEAETSEGAAKAEADGAYVDQVACDVCGDDCTDESYSLVRPRSRAGNVDLCPTCYFEDLAGAKKYAGYAAERQTSGKAMAPPGAELVGSAIEIYWPDDKAWYRAKVTRHLPDKALHAVVYVEDNVVSEEDLSKERWRMCPKLVVKLNHRGDGAGGSGGEGRADAGAGRAAASSSGSRGDHEDEHAGGNGNRGTNGTRGGGGDAADEPEQGDAASDRGEASSRRSKRARHR